MSGKVTAVHTGDFDCKSRIHRASEDDPPTKQKSQDRSYRSPRGHALGYMRDEAARKASVSRPAAPAPAAGELKRGCAETGHGGLKAKRNLSDPLAICCHP
jgi:hypothetical protein